MTLIPPSPFLYRKALKPSADAPKRKYGCLMAMIPEDIAFRISNWSKQAIPEHHLGPGGREDHYHVTIKYGFLDDSRWTILRLQKMLQSKGPFEIHLGKMSLFKNNPDGDVLKVDIYSDYLHELHKEINEKFPNVETHPNYHPHLTIAYLKPEFSTSYPSHPAPFLNQDVLISTVEYSTATKDKTLINLYESEKALSWLSDSSGGSLVQPAQQVRESPLLKKPILLSLLGNKSLEIEHSKARKVGVTKAGKSSEEPFLSSNGKRCYQVLPSKRDPNKKRVQMVPLSKCPAGGGADAGKEKTTSEKPEAKEQQKPQETKKRGRPPKQAPDLQKVKAAMDEFLSGKRAETNDYQVILNALAFTFLQPGLTVKELREFRNALNLPSRGEGKLGTTKPQMAKETAARILKSLNITPTPMQDVVPNAPGSPQITQKTPAGLEVPVITPSPVIAQNAEQQEQLVMDTIKEELAGKYKNEGIVPIWELREKLNLPFKDFNKLLMKMRFEDKVHLVAISTLADATHEQLANSIQGMNEIFFSVRPTREYAQSDGTGAGKNPSTIPQGEPDAPIINTPVGVSGQEVILRKLEGQLPTKIMDLRKQTPELSREAFDAAVMALADEKKVQIAPDGAKEALSDEELKNSIQEPANPDVVYTTITAREPQGTVETDGGVVPAAQEELPPVSPEAAELTDTDVPAWEGDQVQEQPAQEEATPAWEEPAATPEKTSATKQKDPFGPILASQPWMTAEDPKSVAMQEQAEGLWERYAAALKETPGDEAALMEDFKEALKDIEKYDPTYKKKTKRQLEELPLPVRKIQEEGTPLDEEIEEPISDEVARAMGWEFPDKPEELQTEEQSDQQEENVDEENVVQETTHTQQQQVAEVNPEAQSWADNVTDPQAYLDNPDSIETMASMLGMDAAQMTAALQNKVSQPETAQTSQQTTQPVVEKSPQQRIEETIRDASTSPAEVLNDRSYITTLSQQTGLSEKDVTKILKQMDKGGTSPKQEIQPNLPAPKTTPTKPAAKPVEISNQNLKTPEGRHNAIDQVAGEFDKILPLNTQRALSFKKTTQEKLQALANLDTAIFDPIFKMGKGEEVFTHNEYLRRLEASYAGAVDSYPGDSPRDVQKRQAAVKESVEKSRQKILNEAVPGLRKLAEEGVNELNGEPIDLNQVADLYEKYANVLADALLEENGISTSGTAQPPAPQAATPSLKPSSLKSRKQINSGITKPAKLDKHMQGVVDRMSSGVESTVTGLENNGIDVGDSATAFIALPKLSNEKLNALASKYGAEVGNSRMSTMSNILAKMYADSGVKDYSSPNSDLGDESRPDLSFEEVAAVANYAETDYDDVNKALRKGKKPKQYQDMMKQLDSAFSKVKPLATPKTVYRDIYVKDLDKFIQEYERGQSEGMPMIFKGYTSTSTDERIRSHKGNVRMVINAKKGLDVKPYSGDPRENELLLDRGSKVKISKIEKQPKGDYVIYMDQLLE